MNYTEVFRKENALFLLPNGEESGTISTVIFHDTAGGGCAVGIKKTKNRKSRALRIVRGLISVILTLVIAACAVLALPLFERLPSPEGGDGMHWMERLDSSLLLTDVTLPGTHDSGTAAITPAFFLRCQGLTIREQLDAGFRYLDVRLRIAGDTLVFCHSFGNCRRNGFWFSPPLTLDDAAADIYSFLDAHPSETVVFVVKNEYAGDDLPTFQRKLDAVVQKTPEKWMLTDSVPTLAESRGKIVLFRRYGDAAGLGVRAGIDAGWTDQGTGGSPETGFTEQIVSGFRILVQDRYHFSIEDKLTAVRNCLAEAKEPANAGTVRIIFLTTTGEKGVSHPYSVAKRINSSFADMEIGAGSGWIICDFGTEALAKTISDGNFR